MSPPLHHDLTYNMPSVVLAPLLPNDIYRLEIATQVQCCLFFYAFYTVMCSTGLLAYANHPAPKLDSKAAPGVIIFCEVGVPTTSN